MFGKNSITKKGTECDGTLNIVEIFPTIQGEGPFAGCPAIFIRLQGCNLRCTFCDTEFETGTNMTVNEVIAKVLATPYSNYPSSARPLIVITGGEPLLQPCIAPLIRTLIEDLRCKVQIETAGTVWQKELEEIAEEHGCNFYIICSPKTGSINKDIYPWIDAFKYVIKAGEQAADDLLPNISPETGKELRLARPEFRSSAIFVMPCDEHDEEKNKRNLQAAVEAATKRGYRLTLQMHKIAGLQ